MSIKLTGYIISEQIFNGRKVDVLRGVKQATQEPLILKLLQADHALPREIDRLRNEYALLQELADVEGVANGIGYRQCDGRHLLELTDIRGSALDRLPQFRPGFQEKRLNGVIERLELFLKVVLIVGEIHVRDIIHKDLNLGNIVLNPETGTLNIIDFGIASKLPKEQPVLTQPEHLEGTLSYMAPEQTGRMNRSIDYRSDFYALGIILYRMLTGVLPFTASEPMTLVHNHIATRPVPPHEVNRSIPDQVSQIVLKLLAKNAEDRYQSAFGIAQDIQRCLEELQATRTIAPFAVGQRDVSSHFQIPEVLYGRDAEIRHMLDIFGQMMQGSSELVFVAGYSGIGKSALVHEVHKPIAQTRGLFLSGKYDQFSRNVPFAAIVQGFRDLIIQVLAMPPESVEAFRASVLDAVGSNGQVIIEVLPELERIIGPQPSLPEVGATEHMNRFTRTLQRFMAACATRERPLVLFLDDLQWADRPSLDLIDLIMREENIHYLLIIGAYRDNEVDAAHPLIMLHKQIRQYKAFEIITLPPLMPAHVASLLSATLFSTPDVLQDFAAQVHRQTGGNPFFVKMLLNSLFLSDVIRYDPAQGRWNWDIEQMSAQDVTENVVDLMISRLNTFPEETQTSLTSAAALGANFDVQDVALILGCPTEEVVRHLAPAVRQELLVPLDDYRWLVADQSLQDGDAAHGDYAIRCKFAHDRIQQAAYALIPEDEQQRLSLTIGRRLLQQADEARLENEIFEILRHLNNAASLLIHDPAEREQLIRLNLRGALKAKDGTAYEPAYELAVQAFHLLPDTCWEDDYALTFEVYCTKGEIEYLNARWDDGLATFDQAMEHAATLLDRCRVNLYKVVLYRMKNNLRQSLDVAITALEELGMPLKAFPERAEVMRDLERVQALLAERSLDELYNLPEMTDPKHLQVMIFIEKLLGPTYFLGSELLFQIGPKMVEWTLRYGNSPLAAIGYIFYASMTLPSITADFSQADRYGLFSVKLNEEKYQNKAYSATVLNMWAGFIVHRVKPIDAANPPLIKGYMNGVESGNYEFAGYALANYLGHQFWGTTSLSNTLNDINKLLPELLKIDQNMAQYYLMVKACIWNLEHVEEDWDELPESIWPRYKEKVNQWKQVNDLTSLYWYSTSKLTLALIFSDDTHIMQYAEDAEQFKSGAASAFYATASLFYRSVALAINFDYANADMHTQIIDRLTAHLSQFESWTQHAPSSHRHMALLIKAELARITGKDMDAIDLYDQAIASARENNFKQNEAIANQRAALYWLGRGKKNFAALYMQQARLCALNWGANAVAAHIEEQYADLLMLAVPAQSAGQTMSKSFTTTTIGGSRELDVQTIVKAAQALSREQERDQLFTRLMTIAMENAGANHGALLLEQEGALCLEAELHAGRVYLPEAALPLKETEHRLCTAVARYVAGMKESLVLTNAQQEMPWNRDPYIRTQGVKSLMCLPIVMQQQFFGMLYLENTLSVGAFTPQRANLLTVLAAQMAISLENARLLKEAKETARLKNEMAIARHIQTVLLPGKPEIPGYEIAACCEPSDEVGGDYYDVISVSGYDWIVIGDVSGHGVTAGLVMMMVQTAIHTVLNKNPEVHPSSLLSVINRVIYNNIEKMGESKHMTIIVLAAGKDGKFSFSGLHENILVLRADTGKIESVESGGMWIGLEQDISGYLSDDIFKMEHGDCMVLFTDGITEAFCEEGKLFGDERLIRIIEESGDQSALEIRENIIGALDTCETPDDVTLVVMKRI